MKKTLLIGLLLLFCACVSKKKYAKKEQEIISLKKELDSIRNNGLLDNDGDGIIDKNDLCPIISGVITANGCPDIDNDGIEDKIDLCPTVAGLKENGGCPLLDNDNDGVFDKDDACPTVAGSVHNNGCPEVSGSPIEEIIEFCCSNHNPGHCATKMKEMKDLSTKYNCSF